MRYIECCRLDDLWEGLIEPLLSYGVNDGVRCRAIVCPSRVSLERLQSRIVHEIGSVEGWKFFTFEEWNRFFTQEGTNSHSLDKNDLQTILAASLSPLKVDVSIKKLLLQDLNRYFAAKEELRNSGHDWQDLKGHILSKIGGQLDESLAFYGVESLNLGNHTAFDAGDKLQFDTILFYGCSFMDWDKFKLIEASFGLSQNVYLGGVSYQSDKILEHGWLNRWTIQNRRLDCDVEYLFGESSSVYNTFADEFQYGVSLDDRESALPDVRLFENVWDEADYIAESVQEILRNNNDSKIAIIIGEGMNGSIFSDKLSETAIQHRFIGQKKLKYVGVFDIIASWANFQRTAVVHDGIDYLSLFQSARLMDFDQYRLLKAILEKSANELLTDNVEVLFEAAKKNVDEKNLETIILLNKEADFKSFKNAFLRIFKQAKTNAYWSEFISLIHNFHFDGDGFVSKEVFLKWIEGKAQSEEESQNKSDASNVFIMSTKDFLPEAWTHVFVPNMVAPFWPNYSEDIGLISDRERTELNTTGVIDVEIGDILWEEGKTPLLTRSDRSTIEEIRFASIARCVSEKLTLSASLNGGLHRVSEFFERSYRIVKRRAWNPREALKEVCKVAQSDEHPNVYDTVQNAYLERRNKETPFNEYSYCMKSEACTGIYLSCKDWERAMVDPRQLWFQRVLGLRSELDPLEDRVRMVEGSWIHQSLDWKKVFPQYDRLPEAAVWSEVVDNYFRKIKEAAIEIYTAKGSLPSPTFLSTWSHAHYIAQHFVDAALNLNGYRVADIEKMLECELDLGDAGRLRLKGRADLLVEYDQNGLVPHRHAWIIDFKSGGDKNLSIKKVVSDFKGLQLVLYGWAAKQLGYDSVAMSILKPNEHPTPQILDAELGLSRPVLRQMAYMQNKGIFGERPQENFNKKSWQPIATTWIDESILEEKYRLTFESLGRDFN